MTDRHESHDPSAADGPSGSAPRPDDAEIVDAEVVPTAEQRGDTAPASTAPAAQPPADDEEFQRYQEFLEFQRFREWQRTRGDPQAGDTAGQPVPAGEPPGARPQETPPAPRGRPLWKRALGLLRYKFVRRIGYLLLFLLLAPYLFGAVVNHYLGTGSSDSGGPGSGGVPADSVPVKSTSPKQAVRGLYNWLGSSDPERVCGLFEPGGRAAFAQEHGAADCAGAARELNEQVTDPNGYANPKFGEDAVAEAGDEAQVLGCRISVSGGPQLGTFKFERQHDGGWTIAAYSMRAANC
ncbi:hypothetical protein IQ251_10895 [Saccharopolyspora sp. HNM0983]|uniref:Uncharacterized protein n=1 Tax=Saccharopolyspora montiporae TaxID=2781240 RepID=A0A929G0L8_9PSEU|nr:hypothetical protein [Saccharopolyspora sp. HNM0983]MBE9374947.1 hypothetical protein [Saccharopolyspora sp. HNM0983]